MENTCWSPCTQITVPIFLFKCALIPLSKVICFFPSHFLQILRSPTCQWDEITFQDIIKVLFPHKILDFAEAGLLSVLKATGFAQRNVLLTISSMYSRLNPSTNKLPIIKPLVVYMRYWASKRSRWLDIGQVLSCIFINLDEVEVNKNAQQNEVNRAIFAWPWNENARTKQKQQTNGNRAIWLVYRTDTNPRGFWLVKRTLWWKNVTSENFLEINRYFALTSYCNTIGQSNNAFSILGFSLAGKRIGHVLIVSSIGWQNK